MAVTLRENIKPISYKKINAANENAFALMSIIKIAEKDIENGNVRKSEDVFKDLKESLLESA